MYIRRAITKELEKLSSTFRVVTVLGPRQCGKTTLVRNTFKNYTYVNLEDPEIYSIANLDINSFFRLYKTPLIIDEVQRVPSLLNKIQTIVDNNNAKGQFILTGSYTQGLKSTISESLAGRTAILTMLPLSINEIKNEPKNLEIESLLLKGFMPQLYSDNIPYQDYYRAYYQTYVEKDIQSMINIKNKVLFERFISLLAGRVGSLLNYESLANDVGVSRTTIMEWISILEASFVVFRLEPFFENFNKRIIKTPKIYFYDVGFLCYLLRIRDKDQLLHDSLFGHIFENLVILETIKMQYNNGKDKDLYFYRDTNGNEIDLLLYDKRKVIPIEIKSAFTFNKDFCKFLKKFISTYPISTNKGYIVYNGEIEGEVEEGVGAVNVFNFIDTIIINLRQENL